MMVDTMTPAESPETTGNGDTKGTSVIVNAIAVLRTFTADEPLLGVTALEAMGLVLDPYRRELRKAKLMLARTNAVANAPKGARR